MKRTSLHQKHKALGARMVSFAGFEMPLQYSGIIEEHQSVRKNVGLFDLSHMGELEISGPGAEAFLQRMTINDVSETSPGQAQYTAMCLESGGIVDDCVLYRLDSGYLLVVNAANTEKDFAWLQEHLEADVELRDASLETTLIAVQGPQSIQFLKDLVDDPEVLDTLAYYHHTRISLNGEEVFCARTGYTGERGFELYIKNDGAGDIWDRILRRGKGLGILPVGLGARDTLRLEMKYCLYGNDIDESTNPLEAGLGWITKMDRKEFIGRGALEKTKKEGLTRRLVGFQTTERGIPRKSYRILAGREDVGEVTSGCYSPSLDKGIGMGYVRKEYSSVGTVLEVDVRGKPVRAQIVRTPFWKNGTAR